MNYKVALPLLGTQIDRRSLSDSILVESCLRKGRMKKEETEKALDQIANIWNHILQKMKKEVNKRIQMKLSFFF